MTERYTVRFNFNQKEIYQSEISKKISDIPTKEDNEFFYPNERLKEKLTEYYGEDDIIQKLYNWQDYHLHEFFVYSKEKDNSKCWNQSEYHREGYKAILNLAADQKNFEYNKYELNYEQEDFKMALENEVKLKDVLPARIKYIYDYGDFWHHYIKTEEIIDDYKSNKPTLLEDEGTAPPEDVGGVGGFSEFMQIISNPDDEDYEPMLEWAESQRFKEYDPEEIKSDLERYY
ncbi:pRiA4b ORF-3-like protein [Halanaerobium saccharolyticum]|uniref:PRiA4b ORF-3-like protein n=1 Tax=Halanaerobium saccharolyticum TaxID=43595 RepID=A0A4R6LTK6_9FIRM|nr:plasmid pRiA4b ORF-3 family protein [Halanaerobium saccharolyticum]TDO91999.1 pRiA4b ORF-3-like protein [Halanaerobium saccharolyticum]